MVGVSSATDRVTTSWDRPPDDLPVERRPTGAAPASVRTAVPAAVWSLTALHIALMLCYTVMFPAYLAPDEPQHVDMVVALLSGDGWPDPGERILSEGVYRSSDALYDNNGVQDSPFSDGDLPALKQPYQSNDFGPRGERGSLEERGGNAPSEFYPPNQIVQHPPLWHATGALVLAVLPGSERWPYDVTVAVLRLVSVLMVAPLPLLAWAAARRISGDPVVPKAAAAFTLAVPGLTRVGASAGNDALVVLMFAAVLAALARVATGDTRRRTAVATGVLVSLALLSKGFALVLPALVVLAYAFAWWRTRSLAALASAGTALAVSAVGMLWWLRNLVRYDALQPLGYGEEATALLRGTPRPPGPEPVLEPFLRQFFETTSSRFWSGLGVPGPPIFPVPVSTALTILTLVGVVAALAAGIRSSRKGPDQRPALVVLVLPVVLLLVPLLLKDLQSYRYYVSPINEVGVHGRYLYGGLVGLAVTVAIACRRLLPRGRWSFTVATVAALAVQLCGLVLLTERLWVPAGKGLGGLLDGFGVLSVVSPWPPVVTALPFLAAAVLVPVCLVLALRLERTLPAKVGRGLDARL